MKNPLSKNQRSIICATLIYGAIALLVFCLLVSMRLFISTLGDIGFLFFNPLSLAVGLITPCTIIVVYFIIARFIDRPHNNYGQVLEIFNPWVVGTILILITLTTLFSYMLFSVYPGSSDLNKYYGWEHTSSVKDKEGLILSDLKISSPRESRNQYFTEKEEVVFSYELENRSYITERVSISARDVSGEIITKTDECINESGFCSFKFRIERNMEDLYINLFVKQKDSSESDLVSYIHLVPNVLTNNQKNKRQLDTVLILGSFITLLFATVFSGMNNLRQIVKNK